MRLLSLNPWTRSDNQITVYKQQQQQQQQQQQRPLQMTQISIDLIIHFHFLLQSCFSASIFSQLTFLTNYSRRLIMIFSLKNFSFEEEFLLYREDNSFWNKQFGEVWQNLLRWSQYWRHKLAKEIGRNLTVITKTFLRTDIALPPNSNTL